MILSGVTKKWKVIKKHKLKVGDIIYFRKIKGNRYSHAAIISKVNTSSIKFSAHTYSKFNYDIQTRLKKGDYYYAEICHIKNSVKVHK